MRYQQKHGNDSANYQHTTVLGDGSGGVLGIEREGRARTKARHCKTEPTTHTIPERMTVFLRPILSATWLTNNAPPKEPAGMAESIAPAHLDWATFSWSKMHTSGWMEIRGPTYVVECSLVRLVL